MALFKQWVTRPIPANAEIIERKGRDSPSGLLSEGKPRPPNYPPMARRFEPRRRLGRLVIAMETASSKPWQRGVAMSLRRKQS